MLLPKALAQDVTTGSGDARGAYLAAAKELRGVLPSEALLRDEATRPERAAKLAPLIQRTIAAAEGLASSTSGGSAERQAKSLRQIHLTFVPLLAALGDKTTIESLEAKISGPDAIEADYARGAQIIGAFLAGPGEIEQLQAVEHLNTFFEKTGQSDAADLTGAILAGKPAASAAAGAAVKKILTDAAPGPQTAASLKRIESTTAQSALVGKPITLAGQTVDGKAFSTNQWKGKVILVDFWATWCGPCKKELPRIKEFYKQYHDQGLEVLGISNDYTAKALSDFQTADPELAWPSLFDAQAAGNRKWHPLTQQYGITGIPVMYLIDRKGVLRSVTARAELETLIPKLIAEK